MSRHEQPPGAPAEPAADREEGQPGLVLAGEHLQVDTGALADAVEHLRAVASPRGSPRWRSASRSSHALLLAPGSQASCTACEQRLLAVPRDSTSSRPTCSARRSDQLVVVHRRRVRAAVGVDDEQVDRVGADVEHTEPHGPSLPGRRLGPRRR